MQVEEQLTGYRISPAAERFTAAGGAAFIGGGSAFVAAFDPAQLSFLPVCPLYALTGFACPGCGLTRGFHALFHGDWITALDFNALIAIWAVIFAYTFVSLVLLAIRGKGLPKGKEGFGDLYVTLAAEFPATVSEEEKDLWQNLAEKSQFRPRG